MPLTDGWRAYDGLVDVGYEKHVRVHHGNDEFFRDNQHTKGIENSFGVMPKGGWQSLKSLPNTYLKGTEFRFNHRHVNAPKTLLKMLRQNPLS